jgi:hypothetical protein
MMIVLPKNNKMSIKYAPLSLSYESYIPNPKDTEKLFKIVDKEQMILITRLAYCNHISRNRCFYGLDDVIWGLKHSKYVTECIAQGTWYFEYLHPKRGCDLARFMSIDDERIAGRILKYWVEGDYIYGLVQFLEPKGNMLWDYIMKGINLGFSLRIYTPNYAKLQDNDGPYVKKTSPMYPVTFDMVLTPGYEKCRLVDPDQYAANNQYWLTTGKPETMENSTEGLNISKTWFIDDPLKEKAKIEETIGNEALLIDFSSALKGKISNKKKIITNNKKLYVNTQIFHEVMKFE